MSALLLTAGIARGTGLVTRPVGPIIKRDLICVRFCPKSRHLQPNQTRPLRTNSGHEPVAFAETVFDADDLRLQEPARGFRDLRVRMSGSRAQKSRA